MILLVNLVRIIPSIKFISTVDAILGAIVTSHTPKSIEMSQPKYGQIINCYLTILILSLRFPCAAYELRHSIDLALLTKWPVFLQYGSGNPTPKPNIFFIAD